MYKSVRELRKMGVISVKIRGSVKEFDIVEELRIDPENLDDLFRNHSEQFAFWRLLYEQMKTRWRNAVDILQQQEDLYYIRYREDFRDKSEQYSDKTLMAFIRQTRELDISRKEVRDCEKDMEMVKAVVDAFEHRKTCIMQLGAKRRDDDRLLIRNRKEQ